MAQLISDGMDEEKIWLNVVDIDGMLRVIDQDGRELGGCVKFCIDVDVESLTRITLTTNAASRDAEGKIQYKLRG